MSVFSYRASTRDGEIIEGVINAEDERTAVERLRDSHLIPLRVSFSQSRSRLGIFKKRSTHSDVLTFTTELSSLLSAGLPLDRSLNILREISENEAMKEVISVILQSIRGGNSFSDALQKHPKVFSQLYVNMVRAGESGGVLEPVVEKVAEFLESAKTLRDHLLSAMIYPVILAFTGGVSIAILLTYVIPKFSVIFEDLGQSIPLPTQILIGVSTFLSTYWWAILIVAGVTVYWLRRYIETEKGRLRWDTFKLRILGDVITHLETSRFCRTLGTLLKSGVPLIHALMNVKDVLSNTVMKKAIDSVIKGAKEGQGISTPLIASGIFPALATSMIKVGEETGQLDEMLLKVSETYEKHLKVTLGRLISLLEPAMILIMGVIVGFIVMSMLIAILSINELPM